MLEIIKSTLRKIKRMDIFQFKCAIKNNGRILKISKYISGGNELIIGKGSVLDRVHIRIVGQNNHIKIGHNCFFGSRVQYLV